MLHGDLACTYGTVVAVRCVGTLLHVKQGGLFNHFGSIQSKIMKADIDENVMSVMNYIYRQTENIIDLVLLDSEYSDELEEWLIERFPFNRLIVVKGASQISSRLHVGDITYYVDNDASFRSRVGSEYAVPLSDLGKYIPTHARRGRLRG